MADKSKQTIYIDVEDEITSIVEKVRGADKKIVALVLPKRMTTLQSIVNMKLLKRTADEENKKIVLITSETGLLPLAGAVGFHVAKTLQSKPAVPPPPQVESAKEIVTEDSGQDVDEDVDKNKSVGELAGMTAVAAVAAKDDDEDTIDVDSIDDEPAPKSKGKTKASKLKVPNFDKFRMRLFIAAAVGVLLIVGLIFANKVLPKAKVTIKTNSVDVNATVTLTASTDQKSIDVKDGVVPATSQTTQTPSTQQVQASGQQNAGDKASGSVTMKTSTNCITPVSDVPAGSSITNGVVSYITSDGASFGAPVIQGGKCIWTSNAVGVTASSPGAKYNVAAGSQFSVNGYNATATNAAAMTGGTDKTITVVAQADIDTAKQKASQDTDKAKADLTNKLTKAGFYPLAPTLQAGTQTVKSSANVGDQATQVTVTVTTTYTMLGVKQDDLKKLIDNFAKGQIDTSKQQISDYGLDKATIVINSTKSPTNQTMSLQTTATSGASINVDSLKQQIGGKKSGDIKQLISQLPNVQDVTVNLSPFWVSKAPSKPSKITIIVQKQQTTNNDNSSGQ